MRFENVPYRRWRRTAKFRPLFLAETPEYKRVMAVVGKAIKAGKAVTFQHSIIETPRAFNLQVYDTISATIED